jgi:phosphomannomutase
MTEPRPDLSAIVKANDIRGVAGEQLTVEVARALGAAFADVLEAPELIVAHDMRVSSPELSRAVIEGAVRRGAIVADAGLASTDQLYCASGLHRAAGLMVTASHNPARDNGMKLCLPGARPVGRDSGLKEVRRRAEEYLAAGEIQVRGEGRSEQLETLEDYTRTLHDLVPLPAGRPLRVVVDAADAMAGLTAPAVLGTLEGIDLVGLHTALDGTFPHHPADPLRPENLRDLREAVRAEGADLGLAFDGDADRCVVLDETGAPVPPSAIGALIASREIARARAAGEERPRVAVNVVASRHVREVIEAAGGEMLPTPVGHAGIKRLMAEQDAVAGVEHSAHYYFRDFFHADSGMLAALHVLAALVESGGTASELVAAHSPYAASGELNFPVEDAAAAAERVRALADSLPHAVVDELDGLAVHHWEDGLDPAERWWLSLRSSQTESLLRLNVEAEEQDTMERVRDQVRALVLGGTSGQATQDPPPQGRTPQDGPALLPAGASGADVPGWVRTVLRCPDCGGELRDVEAALQCTACGRVHDVEGGIPVLIAGRAEAPTTD